MSTSFQFSDLHPPAIMGIVNLTPDSFSDTARHFSPAAAITHIEQLLAQGAQIIDLGAEASSFFRQNIHPISADEQLHRLTPLLTQLPKKRSYALSIDTRSAAVAQQTIQLGADIINDISAATHDPQMLPLIADTGSCIILTHIAAAFPNTPTHNDPDILTTVRTYLSARLTAARRAGIPQTKIAIDPGLGFGKTPHDNWTLALRAHELQTTLQVPVVLAASRKRFLETPPPPHLISPNRWQSLLTQFAGGSHPRDTATAAITHLAIQNNIPIHRLHQYLF